MKNNTKHLKLLQGIGKVILERRHALHLSQEDLAIRAGLHRTYISDIERGNRNFTIGVLYAIANAVDVTVLDLLEQAQSCE